MWLVPQVNRLTNSTVKTKPHLNCCWSGLSEVIFSSYLSVMWERIAVAWKWHWGQAFQWSNSIAGPQGHAFKRPRCYLHVWPGSGHCEAQSDTPQMQLFWQLESEYACRWDRDKLKLTPNSPPLSSTLWEESDQADSCHFKFLPGTMYFILERG